MTQTGGYTMGIEHYVSGIPPVQIISGTKSGALAAPAGATNAAVEAAREQRRIAMENNRLALERATAVEDESAARPCGVDTDALACRIHTEP